MLTQVSTPAYPGELDLDVDSLWQDAFDAFSVSEQGCIRNELGDGFLESLLAVRVFDGLETDELWHVSIFGCLDSETANTLFLSLLSANVDLDEGAEACLQGVLADVDIAEVFAADLPDAAPESAAIVEEFDGKLLACLGDLVPPNGGATDFGPPPPDDSLLWQYDTGNPGELVIVSPTAADGVVYAGSYDDRVYALDAETGELLWSFKAENGLSPLPLAGGGVVLFRGHALDAYTGELLWRDDSVRSGSNNAAVLSDGTVYIPTEPRDNGFSVRAVDAKTGEPLWETDVPRSPVLPLLFPLTASGGNVYVSDEFQVHALDSTTGRLVWSFDAGEIVQDPPTGSNGVVYLRSYSAAYALDESTGEQLWSYEAEYAGLGRPPYIVDGVWPLLAELGGLRALDAATGQPLWSFEEDFALFVSGVASGMVFVTGIEAFHALDSATGDEIWSLGDGWGVGEVTEVDGVVYANSLTGYLHTFDARTGEPIWSVEIGYHLGGTKDPYLVSGGVVYVAYQLADSGVFAFAAPVGR